MDRVEVRDNRDPAEVLEHLIPNLTPEVDCFPGEGMTIRYPWYGKSRDHQVDLIADSVTVLEAGLLLPQDCLTAVDQCVLDVELLDKMNRSMDEYSPEEITKVHAEQRLALAGLVERLNAAKQVR